MKSQFELLKSLLEDSSVNWLKVDYFKRAKFDMAAWFRLKTGETVESGGIKKAHFMSSRTCTSSSPSLILTMARETGSRNDDGAYDYRSMILAALEVGGGIKQNVAEIQVNRNFEKGFESVLLAGLPVFPQFINDAAEKEWAKLFTELCRHRATKVLLDKQFEAIKKKLDKKSKTKQNGRVFFFEEPTGTTDSIVDKDGNKVPTLAGAVSYLSLELTEEPIVTVEKYGVLELVKLYLKREEITEKINSLTHDLRPYELGIIERFEGNRKDSFSVGGVSVKIREGHKAGGYQHSDDTMKKVDTGEYKIVKTPKTKGRWVCEPIPAQGTVEMTQAETVNA